MKKKEITPFYVINEDFNKKEFVKYDIMPYLVRCYEETKPKDKPTDFGGFKEFVDRKSMYMYWSRCQYEIVLVPLIGDREKQATKIDVYMQIIPNIDVITNVLMENLGLNETKK